MIIRLQHHSKKLSVPAMAYTGCQSFLVNMKIIERFGLKHKDLFSVRMHMLAANKKGIHILGATIPRMSSKSSSGTTLETRQLAYVTSESDCLFLIKEACIALGMITETFPTVGEA